MMEMVEKRKDGRIKRNEEEKKKKRKKKGHADNKVVIAV